MQSDEIGAPSHPPPVGDQSSALVQRKKAKRAWKNKVPQKVIADRHREAAHRERRGTLRTQSWKVSTRYSSDPAVFAARIAYALRTRIIYRSDAAVYARYHVRLSPDFPLLHRQYKYFKLPEDKMVQLQVHIDRRGGREPQFRAAPGDRSILRIRIEPKVSGLEFNPDAVPAETVKRWQAQRDRLPSLLLDTLEGSGMEGANIIKPLLETAMRVGWPAWNKLYIYTPYFKNDSGVIDKIFTLNEKQLPAQVRKAEYDPEVGIEAKKIDGTTVKAFPFAEITNKALQYILRNEPIPRPEAREWMTRYLLVWRDASLKRLGFYKSTVDKTTWSKAQHGFHDHVVELFTYRNSLYYGAEVSGGTPWSK